MRKKKKNENREKAGIEVELQIFEGVADLSAVVGVLEVRHCKHRLQILLVYLLLSQSLSPQKKGQSKRLFILFLFLFFSIISRFERAACDYKVWRIYISAPYIFINYNLITKSSNLAPKYYNLVP